MIRKFQQGGSTNIAIGSPKPYTTSLPGINIPTLPDIQINTTSIFDQMEKRERLNLDKDKLKFQYEELKYKEGKAFMDFAGDMMGTFSTVKSNITGLGGLSSMERYAPVIKNYNDKKMEAMQEFYKQFQYRDPNALMNVQKKILELETDQNYLQAMGEIGLLEKALEYKMKTPSITNGKMLLGILDFASNPNADFALFAPSIMNELADDTTNKDIQPIQDAYLKNLFETTKATKTAVGQPRILPSGLREENFAYSIRTPEQIEEELFGIYKSSPSMKNFLESQGVNPENDIDIRNYLKPFANSYHQMLNNSFKPTTDYPGTILKDIEINPDGSVTSIPEGEGGGKMTEGEKRQDSRRRYFVSMFPGVDMDEFINNKIIEGAEDKWFNEISNYLKQKGIEPKAGMGATTPSKKINIKSLNELGIAYDPENTKLVKGKDGKTYLVTNEEEVITHIDNTWAESTKKSDLWDKEVKQMTGLTTEEWNKWPKIGPEGFHLGDPNAAVYTIEDTSAKGATSGNFDPGVPVDIKQSGLPIRGDLVTGFVSSDLVNQLSGVLQDENLVVTAASNGDHESEAQSIYGTSVDINFKDRTTDDTVKKIHVVMDRLRKRGLRPVYEVKTQTEKNRIMKLNSNLKDSDIEVVSWISDNHFSVYCDYCTQVDAKGKQKSVQGTKSTAIEAAKDLKGTALDALHQEYKNRNK